MTILKIDSSINGANSASRALTDSIVEQLKASNWGEQLVTRDLAANPLPHLTLDAFADTSVLDEFLAADVVVVGAPMYNFNISSQLKSWIDRIAVAGKTFRYTENGPEGLAGSKRVIVAISRGGVYDAGDRFEHVEAYLRPMFNFLGIQPEFVRADGLAVSPEQRDTSLKGALVEVERLAA